MSSKRSNRRQRRDSAKIEKRERAQVRRDRSFFDTAAGSGLVIGLLVTMVALIYLQARGFQFISLDDPQYVSANPVVLNGLTAEGLRWAFAFGTSFYWHPLTWMSHMLDIELFGPDAGSHHMMNVVLHIANTVMLFIALRAMTQDAVKSGLVAALFAVHPLHVESVAWIAERKDLLSTFFWCLALYAYARYARGGGMRWLMAVNGAFILGLFAKPMILTLPFVLLLLDFWPLSRKGIASLVREKISLFALAIGSVIVTLLSQRGSAAVVSTEALSVFDRIGNAVVSYMLYLRDMIWPAKLAAFYPLAVPSPALVAFAAAVLVAISAAVIWLRRSHPYLLVGWLWFLGTLVPVVGLVQAGDQGRADRFTYVPLIGAFIAIVWIAAALLRSETQRRLGLATAGVMLLVLTWMAHAQAATWKDDLSLWARAVAVTKNNYRAENLYGVALTDRGQLEEGIRHYEAAIKVWPAYPEAHNNLGAARMDQARFADAISEFEAAKKAKPRDLNFRYNLAVALDAAGRREDAVSEVKAGLKIDPAFPSLLRAAEVFGISTTAK